jgi:hypothetical protein
MGVVPTVLVGVDPVMFPPEPQKNSVKAPAVSGAGRSGFRRRKALVAALCCVAVFFPLCVIATLPGLWALEVASRIPANRPTAL